MQLLPCFCVKLFQPVCTSNNCRVFTQQHSCTEQTTNPPAPLPAADTRLNTQQPATPRRSYFIISCAELLAFEMSTPRACARGASLL